MAISIHAAQEGCDNGRRSHEKNSNDFNPRSPRGLRLMVRYLELQAAINFNPRSPRGLRRYIYSNGCFLFDFNPRSPRGLRQMFVNFIRRASNDFNPRSPRGLRPTLF